MAALRYRVVTVLALPSIRRIYASVRSLFRCVIAYLDAGHLGVREVGALLVSLGFSAAMAIYVLTTSGALTGLTAYDDGVYFGASLQWVNGSLPYRDFVFVHPPGIIMLLSPLALLGKVIGSSSAFALARIVTEVVVVANAGLASLLLRRHGAAAMVLSGLGVALYPLAVFNASTVTLEPYLIFFCLLGIFGVVCATKTEVPRRALVWAGIGFGIAGLVKVWAVFPFFAAALCVLWWYRRAGLRFVMATALTFGIPAGFFAVMSPGNFFHDVIMDQVFRQPSLYQQASIGTRLDNIFGFPYLAKPWLHPSMAVDIAVVVVIVVLASIIVDRAQTNRADFIVVIVCAGSLACLLVGAEYQMYYSYFPIPFLVPTLVISLHRLWRGILERAQLSSPRPRYGMGVAALLVVVAVLLAGLNAGRDASWQRFILSYHLRGNGGNIVQPAAMVSLLVPPGACTISDSPAELILANRYLSSSPDCPAIVDPYGMFLALNNGQLPPNIEPLTPLILDQWTAALHAARCVVLTAPLSGYVAWDPVLLGWFRKNFTSVYSARLITIYLRRG